MPPSENGVSARDRGRGVGFQHYREGDREAAVDGFLTPVFGPAYRQTLNQLLVGSWEQAVHAADMFFGIEVPELQRWQFGPTEAARISMPVLSMVGGESDPAFVEMDRYHRPLVQPLFRQADREK
jgi:hypothetical protein